MRSFTLLAFFIPALIFAQSPDKNKAGRIRDILYSYCSMAEDYANYISLAPEPEKLRIQSALFVDETDSLLGILRGSLPRSDEH